MDCTRVRIRLCGVDVPNPGEDFGSRAKQLASSLAFGKTVTIRVHDADRYGRTVAEVILPEGRFFNREMVREGMACRYKSYAPTVEELALIAAADRHNVLIIGHPGTGKTSAVCVKLAFWTDRAPILCTKLAFWTDRAPILCAKVVFQMDT